MPHLKVAPINTRFIPQKEGVLLHCCCTALLTAAVPCVKGFADRYAKLHGLHGKACRSDAPIHATPGGLRTGYELRGLKSWRASPVLATSWTSR